MSRGRRRVVAVVVALAVAALAAAATSQQISAPPAGPTVAHGGISRSGVQGDARYRIFVPRAWNGGLVLFAHGYEGEGPGPGSVQVSPLGMHLAGHGYAWAASGYRSRGYRPDRFIADTLALRELIVREIGAPRWTIIHGQSMGGHVAIGSLELHPGVYQGALIECGIIDGVGLVDFLKAYTAAAEYVSGIRLLDAPDAATFARVVSEQWLPIMGAPGAYTAKGRQFDSIVKHLMGGDLPLRIEGMKQRYLMNLNPRDPGPEKAQEFARHASTTHIRYRIDPGLSIDEAELNARIRRIAPAPGARSRENDPVFAELTGRITVPVLTLHETADFRVPFRLQADYRRRTLAAGTSHLLVQRAVRWPGHCAFDGEVREQTFDDLVAWIERGTVPAGDDVLSGGMATLGRRWTPVPHALDRPRASR
jgi:hypothetical protein